MRDEHDSYPTKRIAWRWLGMYLLITGLLYGAASYFPVRPPLIVPMTSLDIAIAFLPATAGLYLSYFMLLPTLVLVGRRRTWFVTAFFAVCVTSAAILLWHLVVPTGISRPPVADSASLLGWIQAADRPLSAFPSLHIALPAAITWVLAKARTRWALVYGAWWLMFCVTVLTTKQHVVWDVVSGTLAGSCAGALAVACQRARVDFRSLGALGLEWFTIAIALIAALRVDALWFYAITFLLISARQHGLLMLYHDAVHGLLARSSRANDLLINALVGVPHLLPVEVYRPLHLEHHRELGTERDPERRFLYREQRWRYQPLPTRALLRQLAGDLFIVNGARTIAAWNRSGGRVRFTRTTLAIAATWIVVLGCAARAFPQAMLIIALLWFVPLLTLTNLLQKLRSFAEHSGGPGATPGWPDWTYSWRPGILGRCTLWPYHINLHREHHAAPFAPWHALPARADANAPRLAGRGLAALLWTRAA